MNRFYVLSVLLLSSLFFAACSSAYRHFDIPKDVNTDGEFVHQFTKTVFPESLGNLHRTGLKTLDNQNLNVFASYQSDSYLDPEVTIYVYPAPRARENRLFYEFSEVMRAVFMRFGEGSKYGDSSIHKMSVVPVEEKGIKTIGLKGMVINEHVNTATILFECGKYFLKFRITNPNPDSIATNAISDLLMKSFSPIKIIKNVPLKPGFTIYIKDSLLLDKTSEASLVFYGVGAIKASWIDKNILSFECLSGVPTHYLDMHCEAINGMLKVYDSTMVKEPDKKKVEYAEEFRKIRDSGFLKEFIYDEYWGLMVVPEGTELKMEQYRAWKKANKLTVRATSNPGYTLGLFQSYEE